MKRLSLDYAGDSNPASEPQYIEDHPEQPEIVQPAQEYNWVYANGHLEISPHHLHDELAGHAGVEDDHTGPIAVGSVHLNMGSATWEIDSNMSISALVRILKDYTKHVGWKWGGLTDSEGEPIGQGSAFAPVKSFVYSFVEGHLYLASSEHRLGSQRAVMGRIEVEDGVATITGSLDAREALQEWAEDEGYKIAGDFNLKTQPDLELHNMSDPNPTAPQDHQYFNEAPEEQHMRGQGGVYTCKKCQRLLPNWHEYKLHIDAHGPDMPREEPRQDSGMASMDDLNSNTGEMQDGTTTAGVILPVTDNMYCAFRHGRVIGYAKLNDGLVSEVHGQAQDQIWGKMARYAAQEPKDMIEGPIPFIFDVKDDKVITGQPNTRTSDIEGSFTPGGIVEGTYEPGGKVYIRTNTNMPYTVRHMIELFYYQQPTLEVKNVFLVDDKGKNIKLAHAHDEGIGGYVKSMVAADPVAHNAYKALEHAGGHVYVVGGAVRDAVMGAEPKDIDLMVTGIPAEHVMETLEKLPGRVDLTGKDFGVYRYRNGKNDVEIALPRRERSTGDKHTDFSVQADHTMNVEDDLLRRDFTANALAVDLRHGHLVDPFGGADDIRSKTLRTITKSSLADDPLRIVRGLVANSRFGLVPDEETRNQISENVHGLVHLPAERIQAELDKLISAKHPADAIRLAHETGALPYLLPEVDRAMGYDQNNPHHELDLGTHLLNVLDRTASQTKDPDVRMAALLHDIGKPDSAWIDPDTGSSHYYENERGQGANHEEVGATMAELRLKQLKYPNARTERIKALISGHMFPAFSSPKGARRFVQKWGDHADDLFTLRWADQGGKAAAAHDPSSNIEPMKALVADARKAPTSQAQLAISGNDLIAVGIKPGPQMGLILKSLTEAVISDPELNHRDTLLELAQSITPHEPKIGNVKLAINTPWGQDWDEWMGSRPAWNNQGHQLGFDPTIHQEGKGFILKDGNVWTWPTHKMRPQHAEYKKRVVGNGQNAVPGTSFHIANDNGQGLVYFIGDGRGHNDDQRSAVMNADPRLKYEATPNLQIPKPPSDFGHGRNILDILERQDRLKREQRSSRVWVSRYPGPEYSLDAQTGLLVHDSEL